MATPEEHWKNEPDDHDYPAAHSYLSLVMDYEDVAGLVSALEKAPLIHRLAKDLLRASRLDLLPPDNAHVASDLRKVSKGKPLSPVLLVAGDVTKDMPLIVADGYHRICASYQLDENAPIPCRMVDLAGTAVVDPSDVAAGS